MTQTTNGLAPALLQNLQPVGTTARYLGRRRLRPEDLKATSARAPAEPKVMQAWLRGDIYPISEDEALSLRRVQLVAGSHLLRAPDGDCVFLMSGDAGYVLAPLAPAFQDHYGET